MATKKRKRIWDNYRVIGEVRKSDAIKFIVGAGIRDGVKYINIREFYLRKKDSEWRPGRDGITIPLQIPVEKGTKIINTKEGFVELLDKATAALNEMPLEDPENAVWIGGDE